MREDDAQTIKSLLENTELGHIDRMDLLGLHEAEATKREKLRLKQARQGTWQIVWGGLVCVLVIATIVGGIIYGTRGPDEDEVRRQQMYNACIEGGGSWIPTTDGTMCVRGEVVQK